MERALSIRVLIKEFVPETNLFPKIAESILGHAIGVVTPAIERTSEVI